MDNLLQELDNKISADQEMLSLLPKNNKKNTNAYIEKINELLQSYKSQKKELVKEIKIRYHKVIRKKVNPEIIELQKKLNNYSKIFLLNESNTSYEKMGLDKIVYDLNHFYKGDLKLVNADILKCINAFKKCNIVLNAEDFNYSPFTKKYMTTFFEEFDNNPINSDKVKDVFEEIYWKCSDLIKHIELNVRFLYFKNKKEIDRFFRNEKGNLTSEFKMNAQKIIDEYKSLKEKINQKTNNDECIFLRKFTNQELDINRFSDSEIKSDYSKITKVDVEKMPAEELETINSNIEKLSNTLYEYKNYLKFKYIIDDMKKRYAKNGKTEYTTQKEYKNISSEERKLFKVNNKINKLTTKPKKKRLFLPNKDSKDELEKLAEKVNTQISLIDELYQKYDENVLNESINDLFKQNDSVYGVLLFVSSYYSYFCKCVANLKDEEIDKDEELAKLKEFLVNPQYNILINNIKILEDKRVEQIIKDRYFLFNIEISEDDLKPDNLDSLLELTNKLVIYNNVNNSKISFKDLRFMCDLKKVCVKK